MAFSQTSSRRRFSWWRTLTWPLRRWWAVIILLLGLPYINGHTPRDVWRLTEALYWEGAITEPFIGLRAIASNITNRVESAHYPDSVHNVVVAGDHSQTNGGCQYSYRCDRLTSELPRSLDSVPARAREIEQHWGAWFGYEQRWGTYLAFSWFHLTVGQHLYDPTDRSALYWTGNDPYWIVDCAPGSITRIGNHNFCRSLRAGSDLWRNRGISLLNVPEGLQGSSEAVAQAWQYAEAEGYRFYRNGWHVWWWQWVPGQLQRIHKSESLRLHQVDHPYLVHEVHTYLTRLAAQYHNHCGQPLVVTSALRPGNMQSQLRNGSDQSVHPAGLAFDLRSRGGCQEWLEWALLLGERRDYVQVTREHSPPHWHVVVYPNQYAGWRESQN